MRPDVVAALADVGITRTFAIQELTLPIALAGHDLIGQARTGTGKTLGFGVPMLQRVAPPAEGGDGVPQALVVVPTRELCVQVARDLAAAGSRRGIRVAGDLRRPRLRAAGRRRCGRASRSSSARRGGCSTWPSRAT